MLRRKKKHTVVFWGLNILFWFGIRQILFHRPPLLIKSKAWLPFEKYSPSIRVHGKGTKKGLRQIHAFSAAAAAPMALSSPFFSHSTHCCVLWLFNISDSLAGLWRPRRRIMLCFLPSQESLPQSIYPMNTSSNKLIMTHPCLLSFLSRGRILEMKENTSFPVHPQEGSSWLGLGFF